MNILNLEEYSRNIRQNIIKTGYAVGRAHFGGSMSIVEVLTFLFAEKLDLRKNSESNRDRFILSKGHCALGLYSALCEFGKISPQELATFNQDNGSFPTHCVENKAKGIELSSGSLGLGLSYSIGLAIALKYKNYDNIIYILVGNGEANEGSFWESVMFAGHKKMDNIVLILDDNGMQNDGDSSNVMPVKNWMEKLTVFSWKTIDIDGHNFSEIAKAFDEPHPNQPLAIISHSTKGKGISFMENDAKWHHAAMTEEEYKIALGELGE